jgi:hypothetical protein
VHFVEIQATQAAIAALEKGPGLLVKPAGATEVEPDRWRVGGYATDEVIAELRDRGYQVTVAMTDRERRRRLRYLAEAGE